MRLPDGGIRQFDTANKKREGKMDWKLSRQETGSAWLGRLGWAGPGAFLVAWVRAEFSARSLGGTDSVGEKEVARDGFEPPTRGSSIHCSTN